MNPFHELPGSIEDGIMDWASAYPQPYSKQYINMVKHTDAELIDTLNIERTQYYKRKKEAINLFGIILWGYIIPPIRDYLSETDITELS